MDDNIQPSVRNFLFSCVSDVLDDRLCDSAESATELSIESGSGSFAFIFQLLHSYECKSCDLGPELLPILGDCIYSNNM